MYEYCLRKSYSELTSLYYQALESDNPSDFLDEMNYRTGTYLYWLIGVYDHLPEQMKNSIDEDNWNFLQALRFVYNSVKHNQNIVTVSDFENGEPYLPCYLPAVIVQRDFLWSDIPKNKRYNKQYTAFVGLLKNHSILSTLEKASDILNPLYKLSEMNKNNKESIYYYIVKFDI